MNAEKYLCPYCEEAMEKGTFRSRGSNYYQPDGEKRPVWYSEKFMKKRRAIMLPPDLLSMGRPEFPVAYVCRSCKVIIMPYAE